MKIRVYEGDGFRSADSLWEALRLDAFPGPPVLSVVGAGGKTSLICRLAQEGRRRGKRVLVTTTTHMYRPVRYGKTWEEVRRLLEKDGEAWLGADASEEKISGPGEALYRSCCSLAELVLVEADGSRRLPVKVPAAHEPVIPDNTSMILSMSGMSALGKPIEEVCFRRLEAEKLYKAWGGNGDFGKTALIPEIFCLLMREGYLKPLKERFDCPVLPVFHQADTPEQMALGEWMMRNVLEKDFGTGGCFPESACSAAGLITAFSGEERQG